MGGGRSKRAERVSEDMRGGTAGNGTGDTWKIGLTPTRSATRLGAAVRDTAGSCAQPSGHFDEALQPGPPWRPCLSGLRQKQTFDPLQHCMPQFGPPRPANKNAPEAYGTRTRTTRSTAATDRHAGRSAARRETHGTAFPCFRLCRLSNPKVTLTGSVAREADVRAMTRVAEHHNCHLLQFHRLERRAMGIDLYTKTNAANAQSSLSGVQLFSPSMDGFNAFDARSGDVWLYSYNGRG